MLHFLLGGYDLEMIEIRNLLEENNFLFSDKNLSWGASVDNYSDVILAHPLHHFVGVELAVRNPSLLPKYYIEIDHHNDKVNLPSSIEQIATMLQIPLTRYQQLIAANDKGYIPAMRALGATEEEISTIRHLDRKTQGVTPEMELIAIEELNNVHYLNHDFITLKTSLDKFSPLIDRISKKKVLIYNSKVLNYYGQGVKNLAFSFKDLIEAQKIYHGGGDNGYFGTVVGAFSESELNFLISKIIDHVARFDS